MLNNLSRRAALVALGAVAGASWIGSGFVSMARALTTSEAEKLVSNLVTEIDKSINSGKTGQSLYKDFERIFEKYGDVPIIAQTVLGVEWRSASSAQRRAFADAFKGYMARKYGKRFHEFKGARIEVTGARPVKSFYQVQAVAFLRGNSPFRVVFLVSDRSGKDKFFNLIIEGVNMRIAESTAIGSMLDKRGGNLDAMIADLRKAG